MRTIEILDQFCKAGGAAVGMNQACENAGIRANITGVDHDSQPNYPYSRYKCDWRSGPSYSHFGFIWSSPPCQRYSIGGNKKSRERYPDLIASVRITLLQTGLPFVIENVPGAPLRRDLMLCGQMFDLGVFRHRIFEIHGFKCDQPPHPKHIGTVSDGDKIMVCRGGRPGCFGNKEKRARLKAPTIEQASKAMGIYHMTRLEELAEAVPPAYSRYIMGQFLRSLRP